MNARSNAFSTDDTIVAIATAAGRGAIGVVRLSGAHAHAIAGSLLGIPTLRPRFATLARFTSPTGLVVDEVVATYFKSPFSYTGEDVVELSAHGSPVILGALLDALCTAGARLARPGEFTLRAYLNGKRDLVQAEAVGDLIEAVTPLQARVAFDQLQGTLTSRIAGIDRTLFDLIARLEASLDFPDEGYHFVERSRARSDLANTIADVERLVIDGRSGRMIREGAHVVLAGRPNVGKSQLFNCLNGVSRAIVTAVPGTTRDLLTEKVDIDGLAVVLVDTAGVRDSSDEVEIEGVRRAHGAFDAADLILLVFDASEPLCEEDLALLRSTRTRRRLLVLNKSDRPARIVSLPDVSDETPLRVSAKSGAAIDDLRSQIARTLVGTAPDRDTVQVSNIRHLQLMEQAAIHLRAALSAIDERVPEEFVLSDLQSARACFDEIVGVRTSGEILAHIFQRFCIGK